LSPPTTNTLPDDKVVAVKSARGLLIGLVNAQEFVAGS
jgi:hypothetical protein